MVESVGSNLLDEIVRISAKRQRWKAMVDEFPFMAAGLNLTIAVMTHEIAEAMVAVQSDDPASAIRALLALRGYDDND